MNNESKESTKKLLGILGITDSTSDMPKKWNGSVFTFSYYQTQLETFLSKGYQDIVDGTMQRMLIPLDPVQIVGVPAIPAPPGAVAIAAIAAETDAEFKIRRDYFQFQYKRCIDNNKDFDQKANAIVNEIENILDNTNRTNLEIALRGRNIPALLDEFRALGIVRNANVGSTSMDQLKLANFENYSIQDIKAVIDVTIRLSDAHREANAKIGADEKLVILLSKAATADSKDGLKFSHLIKDVEINRRTGATLRTYASVYQELLDAQNLYETKNHIGNIVDVHKAVYGKSLEGQITDPKNKSKCIGCRRNNHSINDCRSHFLCKFDKLKAHHIKESCNVDPSKCFAPKKKLEEYLNFNNGNSRSVSSTKEPFSSVLNKPDSRKAKKAKRLEEQEALDYAHAVKLSNEDKAIPGQLAKKSRNEVANNTSVGSTGDLAEIKSLFESLVNRFDTQDNHITKLQNDVKHMMRDSRNSDNRSYSRDYRDDDRSRYSRSEPRFGDNRQGSGRGNQSGRLVTTRDFDDRMDNLSLQDQDIDR